MLTSEDLQNRGVLTGAVASAAAGVNHGSLRRLQAQDRAPQAPLTVSDTLGLATAAELAKLGLPLVRAVGMARSLTREDWQRVLESDPEAVHLIAGPGVDGRVQVAVASDSEVAALPAPPALRLNLSDVARGVFSRILDLRRAAPDVP